MKKILLLVLFTLSLNADMVLSKELIYDSMLEGASGIAKELTGQNDEAHEETCQNEYKKMRGRNSKLLAKEKQENIKLRELAYLNNIEFEEVKIKNLQVSRDRGCAREYYDYLRLTNHQISQISKENRMLKNLLQKRNIHYQLLLKTKPTGYVKEEVNDDAREKAKAELKRQLSL